MSKWIAVGHCIQLRICRQGCLIAGIGKVFDQCHLAAFTDPHVIESQSICAYCSSIRTISKAELNIRFSFQFVQAMPGFNPFIILYIRPSDNRTSGCSFNINELYQFIPSFP